MVISISPVEASSAADQNEKPPVVVGVDHPDAPVDRPVVGDESGMTDEEKDFWHWFKDKLDGIKEWLSGAKGEVQEDNGDN